jgi:hypothetical protein
LATPGKLELSFHDFTKCALAGLVPMDILDPSDYGDYQQFLEMFQAIDKTGLGKVSSDAFASYVGEFYRFQSFYIDIFHFPFSEN